jgi:hypothetical protein
MDENLEGDEDGGREGLHGEIDDFVVHEFGPPEEIAGMASDGEDNFTLRFGFVDEAFLPVPKEGTRGGAALDDVVKEREEEEFADVLVDGMLNFGCTSAEEIGEVHSLADLAFPPIEFFYGFP